MKKIEAIIRPERLERVKKALVERGFNAMAITEVGEVGGYNPQARGRKIEADLLLKVKIGIVVNDEDIDTVINIMLSEARTGRIGGGEIFILPVEDAVKVRKGERGENAV